MRLGVISDIHSNLEALQEVLDNIGNVDAMICPGDIVGYGPNPSECCDIIRALDCKTVLGNHDAAVSDRMELAWFNPHAGRAVLWTRDIIDDDSINYLKSLPLIYSSDDFVMVHGSLKDPEEFAYIASSGAARQCFDEMNHHALCFIGHTHLAEAYVQRIGGPQVDRFLFTHGGKLDLKPGFRYIVNCGSVGQPRDGHNHASFGVYDSDANTVEITRVPYDITAVQSKMREARLPDFLIHRLEHGE